MQLDSAVAFDWVVETLFADARKGDFVSIVNRDEIPRDTNIITKPGVAVSVQSRGNALNPIVPGLQPSDGSSVLILVRITGEGGSYIKLKAAARWVISVLHGTGFQDTDTGSVWDCILSTDRPYPETIGDQRFKHWALLFRVTARDELSI